MEAGIRRPSDLAFAVLPRVAVWTLTLTLPHNRLTSTCRPPRGKKTSFNFPSHLSDDKQGITRPSPGGYSRRRDRGEEAELEDELAVVDSGGNLVALQRMDGAMLASIQIAEHKARAPATFRRETKIFESQAWRTRFERL